MASQTKQVYFNIDTERDLLAFANNQSSFSVWVKNKIREEMTSTQIIPVETLLPVKSR